MASSIPAFAGMTCDCGRTLFSSLGVGRRPAPTRNDGEGAFNLDRK
jgi:hypothetical protein